MYIQQKNKWETKLQLKQVYWCPELQPGGFVGNSWVIYEADRWIQSLYVCLRSEAPYAKSGMADVCGYCLLSGLYFQADVELIQYEMFPYAKQKAWTRQEYK